MFKIDRYLKFKRGTFRTATKVLDLNFALQENSEVFISPKIHSSFLEDRQKQDLLSIAEFHWVSTGLHLVVSSVHGSGLILCFF